MTDNTTPEIDTDADDDTDETPAVSPEVFEDALDSVDAALDTLDVLRAEIDGLDTPLSKADTIALLYGRRNSLTKTAITDAFETLDDVSGASNRTLLKRLLAVLGGMSQSDAETFLRELDRLERRYGDD